MAPFYLIVGPIVTAGVAMCSRCHTHTCNFLQSQHQWVDNTCFLLFGSYFNRGKKTQKIKVVLLFSIDQTLNENYFEEKKEDEIERSATVLVDTCRSNESQSEGGKAKRDQEEEIVERHRRRGEGGETPRVSSTPFHLLPLFFLFSLLRFPSSCFSFSRFTSLFFPSSGGSFFSLHFSPPFFSEKVNSDFFKEGKKNKKICVTFHHFQLKTELPKYYVTSLFHLNASP